VHQDLVFSSPLAGDTERSESCLLVTI